ncbi:hypothetical protein FFWV33_08950 [Flavobacterium faecale]|uniref:DUF262 domain-containing protein n=1 Tax=Flavobacterium faecale TaxID=1355330 RepID=A0A2S1LD46_9FLAO|nr:DUF262 domain-containing protein [Flavobacterium faecale]AWG21654.1 hypothetical protein FFWV33_08950 [Flavobacterium faecale]
MNSAKNIKEILANDNYIIPRYQRNYAWGKAEISQLIKDIDEFFPKGNSEKKSYYLGSLVCFKREDGNFELIDGQQRHTTIILINLVLKNWAKNIPNTVSVPNLKFDSRKKVQNYIENLYKADNFQTQIGELNISGTGSFKDAIEIIQEELRSIKEIEGFASNFYNNVYLFRVEVPEDTDLNHYFEIMNNRGEQLEKHEIVKALLLGKIIDDNKQIERIEQEKFAKIWDACADMNNYVFLNIDKQSRVKLFTNESELIGKNFEEICINENGDKSEELSLLKIITEYNIPTDFPKEEKFIKDKYKSVIDFPNYLLQVLKIKNDKVSLDDKKLLEQFSDFKPDPKEFIFDLLKYRSLFDKFIIKQDLADADESKQNWGIRKLNTDFETTIKTFETDEELTKLQVMLYYSDSTNTYNNWLQEILKNTDFEVCKYTEKVWDIVKIKFNRFNLSYPTVSIFNLYFIDFLLWKLYKTEEVNENLKSLKSKIDKFKNEFNNFKFKQLNSKEHLAAQSNPSSASIPLDELNGIGNLCLISASQNSAGNKENPSDKKKRFIHPKPDNSSLKRLIMFESYENDKWETEQINKHKTEIDILIDNYVTDEN